MTQYQDIWVKGQMVKVGQRECADRYAVIRTFCAQYNRPFTVLDIGANLGYFSVRLAEDFADCTAVAIEGRPEMGDVLRDNGNPRVIWLQRKLDLRDLWMLAHVEAFDVVLAMSVIHHIHANPDATLEVLPLLGDHLIMEIPNELTACAQERVQAIKVPTEAVEIGRGKSHLGNGTRPILRLSRPKRRTDVAYIGCPKTELSMTISSDFTQKRVRFWAKDQERDWHRGINLQTYLLLAGAYPDKSHIAALVRQAVVDGQAYGHRDVAAWNVVLGGDEVWLIDRNDPHTSQHDDWRCVNALIGTLEA